MKLYCKGEYSNEPYKLRYDRVGWIEVDEKTAEFLKRDAPDNFSETEPEEEGEVAAEAARAPAKGTGKGKAPAGPKNNKAVSEPKEKKDESPETPSETPPAG